MSFPNKIVQTIIGLTRIRLSRRILFGLHSDDIASPSNEVLE